MESKREGELFQDTLFKELFMEWDLAPAKQTLKLFYADTELRDAQVELIVKHAALEMENILLKSEWADLRISKRKLKKLFITANKVVKDNKASMFRFNERIKENSNEQELLNEHIKQIREEIDGYATIKNDMETYVKEYSERYTNFLESVAEHSSEFNSVQDILNRYETLENCRRDCSNLLTEEMNDLSGVRKEMLRVIEVKANVLKQFNNSLVLLQVRQKQAKEQRMTWELALEQLKNMTGVNAVKFKALSNSCYDFYLEICNRRKVSPTLKMEDTENQLDFIQTSILFYKEVIRIATAIKQEQQNTLNSKKQPLQRTKLMKKLK